MDWLETGWQDRTKQKLAVAGCLAAALSLRSDPMRKGSRLMEFTNKLAGYSGAALIFSGVQETCRATRGRHDFINSAVSGALTGGVVVSYFQGPRYRLLGVVLWGSLATILHVANAALQPRVLLEDFLIQEGLLSPEVARRRAVAAPSPTGVVAPHVEARDVLLRAVALREEELRALNKGLGVAGTTTTAAFASRTAAPPGAYSSANRVATRPAVAAAPTTAADIDDDDVGYLTWLRTSGYEADALLIAGSASPPPSPPPPPSSSSSSSPALQHGGMVVGDDGSSRSSAGGDGGGVAGGGSGGSGGGEETARGTQGRTSWVNWLTPWRWRWHNGGDQSGGNNTGQ